MEELLKQLLLEYAKKKAMEMATDAVKGGDSKDPPKGKEGKEGTEPEVKTKSTSTGGGGSAPSGGGRKKQYEGFDPDTTSEIQELIASDVDLKDIGVNPMDYIEGLMQHGKKFNPKDIKHLMGAMPFEGIDGELSDEILHGYAEHIVNYPYKYKGEAQKLDPTIDPEQEHIGPMAQDIEEVNPAAVVTDPETTYKSVDTGRLALMNAGAIGDLARELFKLKEEVANG